MLSVDTRVGAMKTAFDETGSVLFEPWEPQPRFQASVVSFVCLCFVPSLIFSFSYLCFRKPSDIFYQQSLSVSLETTNYN